MEGLPNWALGLCGTFIGAAAGFTARRARLCSFGAIEDALMGGDTRRLRIFGLALALAMIATQTLILMDLLHPDQTRYLSSAVPWLSIILGSFLFGLGMALVGTCSFGSLVRLGGGDLRSLVVMLVLGAVAFTTLRGVISDFRILVLESVTVQPSGAQPADLPGLLSQYFHTDLRGVVVLVFAGGLITWALSLQKLRKSPRLLMAGVTLGLCVFGGWLVTGALSDDFNPQHQASSLTFIAPVGKFLYTILLNEGRLADFGVGSVLGVVLGAGLSSYVADEFRWEAYDDDREMRRHLVGAVFMGFGGILAGGCTIGQGLTAGSLLALSWPLAVGGMVLGARLGIYILMGGSLSALCQRWVVTLSGDEKA